MGISQIVFIFLSILTFYWAYHLYSHIHFSISLGQDKDISGNEGTRWKNVWLVAFGQKKMFKKPVTAFLHLFIYVAFLLTQIELIEILIDGLTGTHRIFAPVLGSFYTFSINFIEWLSVFAFFATIAFLFRRNVLKVKRFQNPEMTTWPTLDANVILILEIILIIGIMSMNSADVRLQEIDPVHYPDTGHLILSSGIGSIFLDGLGKDLLVLIERSGWWLHLLVVYAFVIYIPKSKHLHIFLSFPNVYFSKLTPRGEMENMPVVENEVRSMMGLSQEDPRDGSGDEDFPEFGASDIFALSWKNLLDAYSCTECGRCTAVCPANITGKKLSPRKILMDIRDRTEEVAGNLKSGGKKFIHPDKRESDAVLTKMNYYDGRNLFDLISREEIRACTTCFACVEACPVMIDPLEPILKLRRYEILTESKGPADWLPMFTSLENSGAVWQTTEDRINWMKQLEENE